MRSVRRIETVPGRAGRAAAGPGRSGDPGEGQRTIDARQFLFAEGLRSARATSRLVPGDEVKPRIGELGTLRTMINAPVRDDRIRIRTTTEVNA
jgi:hypothetical protein